MEFLFTSILPFLYRWHQFRMLKNVDVTVKSTGQIPESGCVEKKNTKG